MHAGNAQCHVAQQNERKTANVSCASASVAPRPLVRRAERKIRMGEIGILLVGGNFECDRGYRRLRVFSRVLYSHRKDSLGDAERREKKLWKKVREVV